MQQTQKSISEREAEDDCQKVSSKACRARIMPNGLPENFQHDGVAGNDGNEFGLPVQRGIERGRELIAAKTKDIRQKNEADVEIKKSVFSDQMSTQRPQEDDCFESDSTPPNKVYSHGHSPRDALTRDYHEKEK